MIKIETGSVAATVDGQTVTVGPHTRTLGPGESWTVGGMTFSAEAQEEAPEGRQEGVYNVNSGTVSGSMIQTGGAVIHHG